MRRGGDGEARGGRQAMSGREYTEKQIARGLRKLHRAEGWRHDNPDAWGYIVGVATEQARREQPISGRMLIEAVRHKAFTDLEGEDTRTNNDYAPVVARWLAVEHPETARFIERRKTVFDLLMA